jgi:carbamoylphosphate synthase large subunit
VLPVGKAKVSTVETLPVYRIMKPSDDMLKILFIIQQAGGKLSKKHLIEKLQSEDVRLIPVSSDAQTKSASHSRLKPFLEPMTQEWGFVTVKYKGRKSEVLLTEQGRKALKIFGSNFEQTYQTA